MVSGGNEFSGKSKYRNPRLYMNDGKGVFSKSDALQNIFITGSCVAPEDLDGDGDVDVFLGVRAIPWKYGIRPDNYILLNDGKGNFTDETERLAPSLRKFGLVKNATWTDVDSDNRKDLVIAAEWSPITILLNNGGRLTPLPIERSGLQKVWPLTRAWQIWEWN